jgi:DNA mismatch repair protein MutS
MNHLEGQILELVSRLYPDAFAQLDNYWNRNRSFIDSNIQMFDREIQFYIAYIDYMAMFQRHGLSFVIRLSLQSRKSCWRGTRLMPRWPTS